jgi:hypothetical protein
MATKYTITGPAYIKLFFHLAKHPHQRVNGVLIGKETSEGVVEATDAIPLLHHWTSLSPMMEIGLDLVRTAFPPTKSIYERKCYRQKNRLDSTLNPSGLRL